MCSLCTLFGMWAQLMLSTFGLNSTESGRVSEEELRLIVTGAKLSGGIESQEGMMIEGVLDLQVGMLKGVGGGEDGVSELSRL